MDKIAAKARFRSRLLRPAAPKSAAWTFVVLPKKASAKLPTRGRVAVEGTLDGHPFRATLDPDGEGSHWLKVTRAMREAAGAVAGDTVTVDIMPMTDESAPRMPADVRNALAANPTARTQWADLTSAARRDWIHWMTSGKKTETRLRRIANACDMLASGKRRVCCFDRSGMYSRSLRAPEPANGDD